MTGTVELDPDGIHLVIRFPYREDLVAMIKELPGRRWDPRNKVWRVPAKNVEAVYDACSRHLFEFASEIPSLLAGTLTVPTTPPPSAGDRAAAAQEQGRLPLPTGAEPAAEGQSPALTVSQLNERVRETLRSQFQDAFWVTGEVADFDKSAGRQHRFFQLVEKAEGLARPRAVVEVAMFAGVAERLLPRLAAGEPPMTLRDGLEIRVLVKVDFYVTSGRFQVIVQDIDPSFTLGKLALSREQVLRELVHKGIADRNRSLGLPIPALRIGVLTSPEADGWNDFRRHLEDSRCGFDLTLFPIKVQGQELKPTLLAGLRWFAERPADFDALCIVRGGGSRTDLAWFDDREIAIAVARHPLKVLVGIGHQRDQSVLDVIAHSEKTPTAVADFLVRGVESARDDCNERAERLIDAVSDLLADEQRRLAELRRAVVTATGRRLADARALLAACGRELSAQTAMRLASERAELRHATARLSQGSARACERRRTALEHNETRRRLLDPRRVVARGYAIVRGADNRIAPSVDHVHEGQLVRLQFRDGHAAARIASTEPDPIRRDVTQRDVTQSEMTRPDTSRPDVTRPDMNGPDVNGRGDA